MKHDISTVSKIKILILLEIRRTFIFEISKDRGIKETKEKYEIC